MKRIFMYFGLSLSLLTAGCESKKEEKDDSAIWQTEKEAALKDAATA